MQADSRLLLKLLKLRMGQSVADVFCMSGLQGEPINCEIMLLYIGKSGSSA